MENTAKNFALQLGSLITLYVSITALIILLFAVITVQYPDAVGGYWEYESAASSIRLGIALLVVFFPAYLVLTRAVNTIRRSEDGTYLVLTKWLIYLSLVVGGGVMLGDMVAILLSYLNGELTTRFLLKALTMFVVVGGAFVYYLLDARGYWQTHERKSIQYGMVITVIVILSLVIGFRSTESPSEVREMKLDAVQVSDLTMMQSQIEEYYRITGRLPSSIVEAFGNREVPQAPEGRNEYQYTTSDNQSFTLCATFAAESSRSEEYQNSGFYVDPSYPIKNPSDWSHDAGNYCFERFMTAMEYPPVL